MPNTRPIAKKARRGVFISYARSDGEAFAASLRARLEQEAIPLWQDRIGLEGGRDWWLQITEALGSVEFMALVITPNALSSDIVRKEWRYAQQQGVCVYPVKGAPDLDFKIMPRWMRDAHFYDLGDFKGPQVGPEWRKFVNDLHTRCYARRVPFMVEDLPGDFVQRPEEFGQLLSHLLDRRGEEPVAITAALRGAGGYGKTTLARALCHDERVQDAFDDGILWVTLGEAPGDLTGRVEDLIYTLTEERPGFTDINAATARLVELLADRDMLIVVDDVWNSAHLRPFRQGGPRCARLVTTRNLDTLPPNSKKVDVDAMRQEEAVALLGAGLPAGCENALRALAARLGEWPLLLTLVNGALRKRVGAGQSLPDALAYVNKALDKRGLTFFDARDAAVREQAVAKTLGISLEHLNENERARYNDLAIFPEDANVPLSTLERFWGATGGLDEFDTEELCDRLNRLSLLLRFDPTRRLVRLHDVIRDYLIQEQGSDLPALHARLLDAHRPAPACAEAGTSWADMPLSEPYLWDHLAYHLANAGRGDELLATAKDLRYVAAKTLVRKSSATEGDLLAAEELYPDDAALKLLRRHFVQMGHLFNRCETLDDLKGNLYCRLLQIDELSALTQPLAPSLTGPHLLPFHPLPDMPHPALVRTLTGHTDMVYDCHFSPDGSFIVSASHDHTLKVWDAKTGQELLTLKGHKGSVSGCDVSPDGSFIVSASYDGTLKVWDAKDGGEILTIVAHPVSFKTAAEFEAEFEAESEVFTFAAPKEWIYDCAYSPDGRFIVSASADGTLKVWDATSGEERLTLTGHSASVDTCAFSPDGSFIISASEDRTLKVWDAENGSVRLTLSGCEGGVHACAISPDGSLVTSMRGKLVEVWDTRSGDKLFELEGHARAVNSCAFSRDGSLIVSTSDDSLVKVWDVKERKELWTFAGHPGWVPACAISPDCSVVVSGSVELKLWEVKSGGEFHLAADYPLYSFSCMVSPDCSFVVYTSFKTLRVRDVASGTERLPLIGHDDSVHACAVSSDSSLIISASNDKTGKIWEARGERERLTLSGHNEWVLGCAISPDGTLIATASWDKTLKVWDAKTGREVCTFTDHNEIVEDCAFSPDGSFLVSASRDKTLKVWNIRDWKERLTLAGHKDNVNCCAVSSDSALIISGSDDRTAKIWDTKSGSELRSLTGHRGSVKGCAISPDGSLIITAASDDTLKVWEVKTGKCLFTFQVEGGMNDCDFFGDGQRVAAVGYGGFYLLRLVRPT